MARISTFRLLDPPASEPRSPASAACLEPAVAPAVKLRRVSPALARPRAMIASKSLPAGSVPYSRPPSPASREAQKASATAGGAWRTSSEPCRHSAIPSTTRRARASSVAGSANCRFELADALRPGARSAPRGQLDLVQEHLQRARRAGQRAQHVEAHHVARALPDRGQRRLAVQRAACPTPRRSRCRRGTPATRRRGSARACTPSTCPPRWPGA